jgi:hypothetical protein
MVMAISATVIKSLLIMTIPFCTSGDWARAARRVRINLGWRAPLPAHALLAKTCGKLDHRSHGLVRLGPDGAVEALPARPAKPARAKKSRP